MVTRSVSEELQSKPRLRVGLPSRGTSGLARVSMGETRDAHATFEYQVSHSIKAASRLARNCQRGIVRPSLNGLLIL